MTINRLLTLIALGVLSTVPARAAIMCTVSVSGVSFGAYDTLSSSDRDSSGTVTIYCSGTVGANVSYSILLSQGDGTYAVRKAKNGLTDMYYNLYTDASRSQVWGDGTAGTVVISDSYQMTATSESRSYTVYGRVPGSQNSAMVGGYSDNLLATLSY
jgi:spore coat protein U-like protein